MKIDEVKEIIKKENLKRVNCYNSLNLSENEVGIKYQTGKWIIYVTDERANVVSGSILEFNTEEDALEVLIQKARYANKRFK